jgi:probable HAF family extracellular repeat protein
LHWLIAAMLGALATGASAQAAYRVVELPTLPVAPGTNESYAMAMNAKGKVVVYVRDAASGNSQGEVCKPSVCTVVQPGGAAQYKAINKLGVLAGTAFYTGNQWWAVRNNGTVLEKIVAGFAYGINSASVTVGKTSYEKPFRFDTTLTMLPTLGGRTGTAKAINDSGVIVGYAELPDGQRHATQWVDSVAKDLGVLAGGTTSRAHGVNGAGQAVGCSDKALDTQMHAVKFRAGTVVEYTGALTSCAYSINKHGVAVGDMETEEHPTSHVFITDGRKLVALHSRLSEADRAKYDLMWPNGINDAGQIAVTALRLADSVIVALRLDPLP